MDSKKDKKSSRLVGIKSVFNPLNQRVSAFYYLLFRIKENLYLWVHGSFLKEGARKLLYLFFYSFLSLLFAAFRSLLLSRSLSLAFFLLPFGEVGRGFTPVNKPF
jgi:hypothetical protein